MAILKVKVMGLSVITKDINALAKRVKIMVIMYLAGEYFLLRFFFKNSRYILASSRVFSVLSICSKGNSWLLVLMILFCLSTLLLFNLFFLIAAILLLIILPNISMFLKELLLFFLVLFWFWLECLELSKKI